MDAKIFLSCIETDLQSLFKYIESQTSQTHITMNETFESDEIISLINELDTMVYQALIHQLFPKIFTYLPSQYVCRVRIFTRQLEKTVFTHTINFPQKLKDMKVILVNFNR